MNRRIPMLLLLATVLTTTLAGSWLAGADAFTEPTGILSGVPFAAALLSILGAHEGAHYLASRRHGVRSTLPLFIPAPIPPVGTFGAIIRLKSRIPDRRALLEIGAAGPLAGFAVAVPLAAAGLAASRLEVVETAVEGGGVYLGSSLAFTLLERALFGHLPDNVNLYLHPVAFAAWFGFFVTALNLLPIGQLDGGHILYALFGRHHGALAKGALLLLIPLGFLWPGWFLWGGLMCWIGLRHPPVVAEDLPLTVRQKITGAVALVVFVLTFTPAPFIIRG